MKNISSMPVQVKASFWFLIANICMKGISIITTPIFTRILTPTDYGITSLYNSWASIFSIFITLSMSQGVYSKGLLRYKGREEQLTSSLLTLSGLSTIMWLVLFGCFSDSIAKLLELPRFLVVYMIITTFLGEGLAFWLTRKRFFYEYKSVITITLLIGIGSPIVQYVAVCMTEDYKAYYKIIASLILPSVSGAIILIKTWVKGRQYYNKVYWKYALKFCLPLIPHYLSTTVLGASDKIMISKYVGDVATGLYSVSYTLSSFVNIVFNAINGSFLPWFLRQQDEKNYSSTKKVTNALVLGVGGSCLALICIAPEIMKILAPPEYYEGVYIIPPVVLGLFFTYLYSLFANVEFYHEKSTYIMVASIITAITNIILNAIFIPMFGYLAAGYTTLFSYIMQSLLHLYFGFRIEKNMNKLFDFRIIACIVAVLMTITFLIVWLYDSVIVRWAVLIVIGIICIIFRKRLLSMWKLLRNK